MLRNYFKVTIRNIYNNKVYSLINIGGLCLGITTSILLLLWVADELGYDRHHTNADDLYRTVVHWSLSGQKAAYITTPAPFAEFIREEFPEIKHTTRFVVGNNLLLTVDETPYNNHSGVYADPAVLDMFTFDFYKGDPNTALNEINSIVLSRSLARIFFGDTEPVGKTIRLSNTYDLMVTGVYEDIPENSHLQFDFIIPFERFMKMYNIRPDNWEDFNYFTYLQLNPGTSGTEMQEKITTHFKNFFEDGTVVETIELQPLTRIHLYSDYNNDLSGNGDIQYVYIFTAVALFILFIACINFMNLATARSVKRSKEIGLRKTVGAGKKQLVIQFLGEAYVFTLIAIVLAVMLVELLMPYFNDIAQKHIDFHVFSPSVLLLLGGILVITGLFAGLYPALFLSSFKPVKVLKGTFQAGRSSILFRKGLVVMQFLLSIMLIAGTLIVNDQLSYIRNRKLGLNKDNILVMPIQGELKNNIETFKNELLANPGITTVTTASQNPTNVNSSTSGANWEGKTDDGDVILNQLSVDKDFIQTFEIEMADGRPFMADRESDSTSFILNREAVRRIGLEDPVGTTFSMHGKSGTIIGITEDFHFESIHTPVGPLVLFVSPDWRRRVFARVNAENLQGSIAHARQVWEKMNPAYPFEYSFLDESFNNLYRAEMRTGVLFDIFAVIAIFISCMGLYGLASFTAELRVKEVGVRKVMGASVFSILYMFSRDYIRLIIISFVLACPLAYLLMSRWLSDFAYKITISPLTFIYAILVAIILTLVTVGYQSLKAAIANPVNSLRSE